MGLLDKLKSLFSDDSTSQTGHPPQDTAQTDVTVEYEPDAESEHAVKGTDQSPETTQAASAAEAETADSAAAETEATDEAAEPEPAEAAAETETTDEAAEAGATEEAAEPEATDETTESAEESAESAASVEEIKGIGPTYAGRLEAAGIETVADLAAADAAVVAEAAETTETRAFDWVERAQAF